MSKIVDLTGLSRFWSNVDKKKASIDGTYPLLVSGDLAGRGESVPASFGFRASGGKSIKDGRAYIKRIKGNSVVWNQLAKEINATNWGVYNSSNASPSFTNGTIDVTVQDISLTGYKVGITLKASQSIVIGHIYLAVCEIKCAVPCRFTIEVKKSSVAFGEVATTWTPLSAFVTSDQVSTRCIISPQGTFTESANTYSVRGVRLFDLTQMFGAGNEPKTIEEYNARKPIVEDEYAYNEGQVIHCNTESIKSIGDNAWDEQWRLGFYVSGQYIDSTTQICSKNPIQVLPNESYCINQDQYYVWYYDKDMRYIDYAAKFNKESFVTPSNAAYIHFNLEPPYGVTYKNDIIVTLVHSGWKAQKDDQYQPYWQDILPLPIISKYFPNGMKKAGSAHDEIRYNKASGKWEYSKGRIKSVDLGDLDWSYYPAADGYPFGFFYASPQGRKYGEKNILCGKYAFGYFANDKSILGNMDGENIYIMDSAYTDAASFKAMLQEKQVKLYYESTDWEWEELDAEDQNFRDYYNVADFGTEMSQSNVPSAAFSADIIYQFNAVDMIREHEMEINELQDAIKAMQAQLTSLINK